MKRKPTSSVLLLTVERKWQNPIPGKRWNEHRRILLPWNSVVDVMQILTFWSLFSAAHSLKDWSTILSFGTSYCIQINSMPKSNSPQALIISVWLFWRIGSLLFCLVITESYSILSTLIWNSFYGRDIRLLLAYFIIWIGNKSEQ